MVNLLGKLAVIFAALNLAACSYMPNDGPLLKSVVAQEEQQDDFVYGLVDLNPVSIKAIERHDYYPLSSHFGNKMASVGTRVGIGDVLAVTIFEAGPDGIFSTAEKKSVQLDLTVQEDGRISIPFAGTVQVLGRSPEQIRTSINGKLKGRAVEPDVIVNVSQIRSKTVVVNGAVNAAKPVPLLSGYERLLDVIGSAGGPSKAPYDTYVSVSREGDTRTVLLQTLIDQSSENIYVRPQDSIFLTHDPRTFTALGAVTKKGRYPLETAELNLLEAVSQAGGLDDRRADPGAYFVFRYEYEHVVDHLIQKESEQSDSLVKVLENESFRDKEGRVPMVYRVDLTDPDNFFLAKRFPVRSGDVIYVSRKPVVDFAKVVTIAKDSVATGRAVGF